MTRLFRTAGIAAACLACIPLSGEAQSTKPIGYGISAGASMPSGDFGDLVETGYNAAIHMYFRGSNRESRLQFRGNVTYDHWNIKTPGIDGSSRAIGGSVDVMLYVTSRDATIRPYLLGGGGFYNYKVSQKSVSLAVESGATKPAVQGGGGLEFNLAGFSTMIEAKFINVFAEGGAVRWIPISFGIHL